MPCACRAPFCHTCWDRSLAASISACGLARCPSCRTPMRVDFDISLRHVVFSRAAAAFCGYRGRYYGRDEDPLIDDWQQRLYEQAKPTQIHLLQQFGGRAPQNHGGVLVRPLWPWPRSSSSVDPRLRDIHEPHHAWPAGGGACSSTPEPPPAAPEGAADAQPQCVCGSCLRHVSVQDRVRAFVTEEALGPPSPHLVDRLLASPPIFCDICERRLNACQRVWTCENGRRTVLHAAAYDVCEACFALHVHGDTRLAADNNRDPARSRWKSGRVTSRWT